MVESRVTRFHYICISQGLIKEMKATILISLGHAYLINDKKP